MESSSRVLDGIVAYVAHALPERQRMIETLENAGATVKDAIDDDVEFMITEDTMMKNEEETGLALQYCVAFIKVIVAIIVISLLGPFLYFFLSL